MDEQNPARTQNCIKQSRVTLEISLYMCNIMIYKNLSYMLLQVTYEGESKSLGQIHSLALIEVTVPFRSNFSV